jgi:hypothetical protein
MRYAVLAPITIHRRGGAKYEFKNMAVLPNEVGNYGYEKIGTLKDGSFVPI